MLFLRNRLEKTGQFFWEKHSLGDFAAAHQRLAGGAAGILFFGFSLFLFSRIGFALFAFQFG